MAKTFGIWATGGGPTGGRAILGMLKYLEDIGIWPNHVKVLGGTSIGAYVLTVASLGKPMDETIEISFECPADASTTPNLETKVGPFNVDVATSIVSNVLFEGRDPNLGDTPIPMVMAATNWSNLETKYRDGNFSLLTALREAISNPLFFDLEQTPEGIIGDSGISSSVGVAYLREKYHVDEVILFDVQSEHKWAPKEPIDTKLPILSRLPIQLSIAMTKLPLLGPILKKHYFPAMVSFVEHLPYEVDVANRATVAFLTRIIDLEIEKQKPSVVIRLEDAIQIKTLGPEAYTREVGMQQISIGYQAAKVKAKELAALMPKDKKHEHVPKHPLHA
jgi:predicted acylesterase/phospholipase RssA